MMLFRLIKTGDLDEIYNMAKAASVGITTLPADKNILQQKIQCSLAAMKSDNNTGENQHYVFVLEDISKKKIAGVSAIESNIGMDVPFYSYKISTVNHLSTELNINQSYQVLHLVNDYQGATELCTLYVKPQYRHGGNGQFLSRARLLFMAQHAARFSSTVIADVRGYSVNGQSPFWNNLGAHFFDMDFAEADRLTVTTDKQFIADLMPQYPIYVPLLSKQAQKCIAKPHKNSKAVVKILAHENFNCNNYVDIFDAGPTLEANFSNIKTVKTSQVVTIASIEKITNDTQHMIGTTTNDFRAVSAALNKHSKNSVCVSSEVAKVLSVDVGDKIRIGQF